MEEQHHSTYVSIILQNKLTRKRKKSPVLWKRLCHNWVLDVNYVETGLYLGSFVGQRNKESPHLAGTHTRHMMVDEVVDGGRFGKLEKTIRCAFWFCFHPYTTFLFLYTRGFDT